MRRNLTRSGVYISLSARMKFFGSGRPPGNFPLLQTMQIQPSGRLSDFMIQSPEGCPPYIKTTIFLSVSIPNSCLTWKEHDDLSLLNVSENA